MNIRNILAILVFVSVAHTSRAQDQDDYNNIVQKVYEYYNRDQPDSIYTLFSDNLQQAASRTKFIKKINELHKRTGDMVSYRPVVEKEGVVFYTTNFTGTTLSLMIKVNMYNLVQTFRFIPLNQDTSAFSTSNFFYSAPTGTIYGTLTEPPGINKVPVVLIIPGAGPVDRNGNNAYGLNANTYKLIADSLKKAGIASLRYDKRGVAENAPALKLEDDLTFDDFISDAAGQAKRLREYWRFNKVFILGHSDGSLIGMKVAEKVKVDGFISVSGVAASADKLIEGQIRQESKKLAKKARLTFDSMRNGYEITVADSAMNSIFNVSIQTYLKSWMKYNPEEEIKKVTVPVLLLQGTTDLQTNKKDGKKLQAANPKTTLTYIEDMNYVMKLAPKEKEKNLATYADSTLPLSPGLVPAITNFIKNH